MGSLTPVGALQQLRVCRHPGPEMPPAEATGGDILRQVSWSQTLGPPWGLQNREEGRHQEGPMPPKEGWKMAQSTAPHLRLRWGQQTTPNPSTSLLSQKKPQALAQGQGGARLQ